MESRARGTELFGVCIITWLQAMPMEFALGLDLASETIGPTVIRENGRGQGDHGPGRKNQGTEPPRWLSCKRKKGRREGGKKGYK